MNWRAAVVLSHMRTVKCIFVHACAMTMTTVTTSLVAQHSPGNGLGDIYQIDVSAVTTLEPPK